MQKCSTANSSLLGLEEKFKYIILKAYFIAFVNKTKKKITVIKVYFCQRVR